MAREIRDLTEVIDQIRFHDKGFDYTKHAETYDVYPDGTIRIFRSNKFHHYSTVKPQTELVAGGEPGRGVPKDALPYYHTWGNMIRTPDSHQASIVRDLILSVSAEHPYEMYEIEIEVAKPSDPKEVQIKLTGKNGNSYLYLTKEQAYQLSAGISGAISEFEKEKEAK